MSAEVIDIGRYAKVPLDIIKSKISHRAYRVWSIIAADVSPESPDASVRQSALAETLHCSTDTIGRAIAELIKHGLLCEAGKWNQGRCKIYRLIWSPTLKVDEQPAKKEAPAPNTDLNDLLAAHGAMWAQAYDCFDGHSGRPTLRECVNEALSNASRAKGADLKNFIDGWLHIASQRWRVKPVVSPIKEVARPPGEKKTESEEEREWITAQIKIDNEKQRRKEAMEARQRASYGGRGNPFANKVIEPRIEPPVCRENYPLSWAFLRIKWAESQSKAAA